MKHHSWRLMLLLALGLWLLATPVAADLGSTALLGQSFVLEAGQRLNGDVAIFAGSADVGQGAVITGDLAVIGGSARIDGTIEGDAVVLGGSMSLGPDAWVKGDVVAMGELARDPGAQIGGDIVAGSERSRELEEVRQRLQEQSVLPEAVTALPAIDGGDSTLWQVLRWVIGVVGLIVVCVVASAILPEAVQHISEVMGRSAVLSAAVGLVTVLASILLVPLLVVIVVGIPVAIVLVIALGLALLCGWASAARLVGRKLLDLLKISSSSAVLHVAVGVTTLAVLGRVPCLGTLLSLVLAFWGLGAVVLTRFGTSRDLIWEPFEPLAASAGMAKHPAAGAAQGAAAGDGPSGNPTDTRELSPWDLDEE